MKITKELRSLSPEELNVRLEEFKKELLAMRANQSSGVNPTNPGKLKMTRKNIARLLTLLSPKNDPNNNQNNKNNNLKVIPKNIPQNISKNTQKKEVSGK